LRLGTLWIVPAIFVLLGGFILIQVPPSGRDWFWVGMGLIVGGVIGWWRARLIKVSIDPATGRLNQISSFGALYCLAGLMLVRWVLRMAIMLGAAQWHFGAMLISNIFIAVAIGALAAYRVELYLRARLLLRDGC